jgi:signal-transduction protein with cAMP-binding, CBS, and nucleotidyltransferase domain
MLSETNTLHRLEQLTAKGEIQQALCNEVALAHNYLMGLRFRTQVRALNENRKPNNHIEISLLTDIEKSTLKKIFSVIADIQSKLSADYK